MNRILLSIVFLVGCIPTYSQTELNDSIIEHIVKNERRYFDEITEIYNSNDPMLHVDDVALVYYGQAFLPQYNPGKDENEKALKKLYEGKRYNEIYNTAKKILAYNPVSLNALFSIYIASKELGKDQEECLSYLKKYQNIIDMICRYGNGKSSETPFRIITPDDQEYIMFGKLQIENVISQTLDTETQCNIVTVKPSGKFTGQRVYFDISLFLSQASRE